MIQLLPDATSNTVREKINEIIEVVNHGGKPDPQPSPAPWSNTEPKVETGWRPKDPTNPTSFWLDPDNFMRSLAEVPPSEIEKWDIEHAPSGS